MRHAPRVCLDVDSPDTNAPPADRIRAFLSDVRARLRRHDGLRVAYWALAALLALGLLLPLVALAVVGARPTAIAVLAGFGLIGGLVALAALVLGVIVPARRWRGDAAVARWVGRQAPPVASDLLSAVELRDAAPRPGAPSPALVDALVEATARKLDALSPRALVPVRAVRHASVACLGALAVHAGVVVAAPRVVADGWLRVLEPPRAAFGGAASTPTPLVGDLHVRLEHPTYTRRPPTELASSSGEFRAMPGTRVTLTTRPLEPVTNAWLVLEHAAPDRAPEELPMVADGDALRVSFVVDGPARYRFGVERPGRHKLIEATPRQIEIEPDLAPTVELLAPADELDVTSMKRVELAITAEDDHGLREVELVWSSGGEQTRKPLAIIPAGPAGDGAADHLVGRVQAKVVWDLAEVALAPGARVDYHVEVTDNDAVGEPNVGTSKVFHLRVFSPRERHEQHLARQQEVAEKMLRVLAARLTLDPEAVAVRDELHRVSDELVVELGTLVAAYDKDPQADKRMRADLDAMRGRIDKLTDAEKKLLDKLPRPRPGAAAPAAVPRIAPRFAASDRAVIAELEDDVITLADWLDRERLETLLDISDEIAAHRRRLDELMEQYAKTGDPRLAAEIQRELKALEQRLAELAQKRAGMADDVLDQFVHTDAMQDKRADGCVDEVRRLFDAGQVAEAQAKLATCSRQLDDAARAMEQALDQLRGDKFSDEQRQLDELMNELADVAEEQTQIAAEADRIFERYAEQADDLMKDKAKEARRKLATTLDKLRDRLGAIPEAGVTPFAQEELDIVERRLDDLEHMLEDGDLAEALGMARQAKQSLDTVSAELEAAIEDDPGSPWAKDTADSLDAVERAHAPADKLIEELEALAPSPEQIMDGDDKKALDRLRRRQGLNEERAKKLGERAKAAGGELPGDAGQVVSDKVGDARRKMDQAEGRMKARDPAAARDAARAAAEALQQARDQAKKAARQQLSDGGAGLDDEPIQIPGADEYRAPERFREDILEAMKQRAPEGFDDLVQRYYEELIR